MLKNEKYLIQGIRSIKRIKFDRREKGLFPEIMQQQIWCLLSCPHFQKVLWCSGLEYKELKVIADSDNYLYGPVYVDILIYEVGI